jgi:AcrR family transcriptional regulator
MPRPRTVPNEAILAAARAVFTRDGPQASTELVASEAGVSEGTVFKRFGSKERLLAHALATSTEMWRGLPSESPSDACVARELERILVELIGFFREFIPRMMMLMSSGGLDPVAFWRANPQSGALLALRDVTAWMERAMAAGSVARQHAEVAARAVLGACQNYVFFELAGINPPGTPLPEPAFVRALAQTLHEGLRVRDEAHRCGSETTMDAMEVEP